MSVRMVCSAARSAAVTGSKPPIFLFSTVSAVRKNGRMVSPDTVASWSTKLAKSMAVMPPGLSEAAPAGNWNPYGGPACLFARFAGPLPTVCGISATSEGKCLIFCEKRDPQPCKSACRLAREVLIFVRRGVNYCNAVARATVALLGRFLPRLGPLAPASGPFFMERPLFGGGPVGPKLLQWDFTQTSGQGLQISCQAVECR